MIVVFLLDTSPSMGSPCPDAPDEAVHNKSAIQNVLSYLELYRLSRGCDRLGEGIYPTECHPTVIFWFTDGLGDVSASLDYTKASLWNHPEYQIYAQPYRWDQRICTFLFSRDADKQSLFNSLANKTLGFCHHQNSGKFPGKSEEISLENLMENGTIKGAGAKDLKSLPPQLVIMIIEKLPLKDALELCKALQLAEQVAVQYHAFDHDKGYYDYYYDGLKPDSFKCLLKNKSFLAEALSTLKLWAAFKSFDLDFAKKYIKEFNPVLCEAPLLYEAFNGAIVSAFTEAVKCFLRAQIDPSYWDNYPIIIAAQQGHLEIVKLLLEDSRVNPSDQNNLAIIYAARRGHLEMVKLLLSDSRVNPSAENNKALYWAARNGHVEIVKLLLSDSRVNPSDRKNRALHWAVKNKHSEIVELLILHPALDMHQHKSITLHNM